MTTIVLDGVEVTEANASDLAYNQLCTGRVFQDKGDIGPSDGMTRALASTEGSPLRAALEAGVIRALREGPEAAREEAVRVVGSRADFDSDELIQAVVEGTDHTPWKARLLALLAARSNDPSLREALRGYGADPAMLPLVVSAIAKVDSEWTIANASLIGSGGDQAMGNALWSLPTPQARTRFIQSLLKARPDLRETGTGIIREYVRDPAETDALERLLAGEAAETAETAD